MTTEAVFKATFVDVKTIKTRKVCQFVFEVAQEQATQALECLGGLPRSDIDVWVAIARLGGSHGGLDGTRNSQDSLKESPAPSRKWSEIPPSQQAGIRCNDPNFIQWVCHKLKAQSMTPDEVAGWVRDYCMVSSRSDLDTDKDARAVWYNLDNRFQVETGRMAEMR